MRSIRDMVCVSTRQAHKLLRDGWVAQIYTKDNGDLIDTGGFYDPKTFAFRCVRKAVVEELMQTYEYTRHNEYITIGATHG